MEIPDSVQTIGTAAFYGCRGLIRLKNGAGEARETPVFSMSA
jgi:hypothetical protein